MGDWYQDALQIVMFVDAQVLYIKQWCWHTTYTHPPIHVKWSLYAHSVVSDSATPWTAARQAPLSMGILQARILEGVGCHALLQGIFPTQGSNPGSPHCRQILYRLSHQRSLVKVLAYEWILSASPLQDIFLYAINLGELTGCYRDYSFDRIILFTSFNNLAYSFY